MIEIFEQFSGKNIGSGAIGDGLIGFSDVVTEDIAVEENKQEVMAVPITLTVSSQLQSNLGKIGKSENTYSKAKLGTKNIVNRARNVWVKTPGGAISIFGKKEESVIEYLITDDLAFLVTENDEVLVTNNTKIV